MVPSIPTIGRLDKYSGAHSLRLITRKTSASKRGGNRSLRESPEPLSSTNPASRMPRSRNQPRTTFSPRAALVAALSPSVASEPIVRYRLRVSALSDGLLMSRTISGNARERCSASTRVSAGSAPSRVTPLKRPPSSRHCERNTRSIKSVRSMTFKRVVASQFLG